MSNKNEETYEKNEKAFHVNDSFFPSKKMWNIVIYKDENNNFDFISWLLMEKMKKSKEEINKFSKEFYEHNSIVIATYIWEISETIKHLLEVESHKNEYSLRIQLEPVE